MGATLAWLKVVDTQRLQLEGGSVTLKPGIDNIVELTGPAPAEAAPFLVLRAWTQFDSAITESWMIRDPHGRTVHEGITREVLAADAAPNNGGLADEVEGLVFEYGDTGYQLVVSVDGREVARADFEVREPSDGGTVQ
jgi:hypothetical protein